MAVVYEIDRVAWDAWVAGRPPVVQALCRRLPPDRLYRLKTSGHRVLMYSYNEDGTVSVVVNGTYNAVAFERCVFGINPDDLEECELPGPDETVGAALTDPADIEKLIDAHRKKHQAESN